LYQINTGNVRLFQDKSGYIRLVHAITSLVITVQVMSGQVTFSKFRSGYVRVVRLGQVI